MMDERGDAEIIAELHQELAGTRQHVVDLAALVAQQSALLVALDERLSPPPPVAFVKQANRHNPDAGVYGDCFRTCIAGLLGKERDSVPHFADPKDPWHKREIKWLALRDVTVLCIWYPPEPTLEEILLTSYTTCKHPCILSGKSRNGTNHAVIAYNGMIWHDPAINDSGIVGPMEYDDGSRRWSLEWLVRHPASVPASMVEEAFERGGPVGIFNTDTHQLSVSDNTEEQPCTE